MQWGYVALAYARGLTWTMNLSGNIKETVPEITLRFTVAASYLVSQKY